MRASHSREICTSVVKCHTTYRKLLAKASAFSPVLLVRRTSQAAKITTSGAILKIPPTTVDTDTIGGFNTSLSGTRSSNTVSREKADGNLATTISADISWHLTAETLENIFNTTREPISAFPTSGEMMALLTSARTPMKTASSQGTTPAIPINSTTLKENFHLSTTAGTTSFLSSQQVRSTSFPDATFIPIIENSWKTYTRLLPSRDASGSQLSTSVSTQNRYSSWIEEDLRNSQTIDSGSGEQITIAGDTHFEIITFTGMSSASRPEHINHCSVQHQETEINHDNDFLLEVFPGIESTHSVMSDSVLTNPVYAHSTQHGCASDLASTDRLSHPDENRPYTPSASIGPSESFQNTTITTANSIVGPSSGLSDSLSNTTTSHGVKKRSILISVGVVSAAICLFVLIFEWCRRRNKRRGVIWIGFSPEPNCDAQDPSKSYFSID